MKNPTSGPSARADRDAFAGGDFAGRLEILPLAEAMRWLASSGRTGILRVRRGQIQKQIPFEDGKILNANFSDYRVPRFADTPKIDVHLVDNRDIPSAGGGETPIIAIAPAIANAVFAATGLRIRCMPMRDERLKQS